MQRSTRFASLLVGLLFAGCVGIASAEALNVPAEAKSGKPVKEVVSNPEAAARSIAHDYFREIVSRKGSDGIALIDFAIVNVDASDLSELKVSVALTYDTDHYGEWPPVEYSIVPVQGKYQVKKQVCVMDAIPDSPGRGTVSCSKPLRQDGSALSVSF